MPSIETQLQDLHRIVNRLAFQLANSQAPGSTTTGDAGTLGGHTSVYYLNASNISAGILSVNRLDPSVTRQGNTFNSAGGLVQLNTGGKLPALDGSLLTNLPSSGSSSISLSDNLTTTAAGSALDARQGATLKGLIDTATTTIGGKLSASSNLSDIASASTARTNLGLGTIALKNSLATGDIPDLSSIYAPVSSITTINTSLSSKQATLVSGSTIKTINGTSLLGSGDITVTGGGTSLTVTDNLTTSATGTALDAHQGYVLKGLIDGNTTAIGGKQSNLNIVNVKDYGAAGDGTTNDAAALNAAIIAAKDGILLFEPNKKYAVGSALTSVGNITIEGNNSTLIPTTYFSTVLNIKKVKGTYASITPFTTAKGSNTFTIPAGVTVVKGDVVQFQSSNAYLAFTNTTLNYYDGMWATVDSVSGSTCKLSTAFYDAFAVSKMVVYEGLNATVRNLNFDVSGVSAESYGLWGTCAKLTVEHCGFYGNDYSGIGVIHEGENLHVLNCTFSHFLNTNGIAGGGRLGYGVNISGNNSLVENNTFYDCKHAVTVSASSRMGKVFNVDIVNNTVTEDFNRTTDDYKGSIDVHASCADAVNISHNRIAAYTSAFSIRNGAANIEHNTVFQYLGNAGSGLDLLFVDEADLININFNDNDITLDNGGSGGYIFGSAGGAYAGTTIHGLHITNNRVTNGSIIRVTTPIAFAGVDITGNNITNAYALVYFSSATFNVVFDGIKIDNNKAYARASTASEFLIRLSASAQDSRSRTFSNLSIANNTLDQALNTGTGIIVALDDAIFTGVKIVRNNFIRGNSNFRGIYLQRGTYTDVLIDDNTMDTNALFNVESNTANVTLDNVVFTRNKFWKLNFQELSTGYVNFKNTRITNNYLYATSGLPIQFANAASSAGWTNSTELLITGNTMQAGSTNSVSISANSTGNKIVISGNVLSSPILDSSATYYKTPAYNTLLSGTQTWKGSTTVGYNGTLTASAAPSSGTWVSGDRVYNSAPTATGVAYWTYDGSAWIANNNYSTAEKAQLANVAGLTSGGVKQLLYSHVQLPNTASTATENTVYTATIPANSITANGSFQFFYLVSCTNSANNKTIKIKINGTIIATSTQTTATSVRLFSQISNRNSLTAQVGGAATGNSGSTFTSSGSAVSTFSFDTSTDLTLTITLQTANSTESLAMEDFQLIAIN